MAPLTDDGGPVFPRQYDDVMHDGITIWDDYAKAALTGELASQDDHGGNWPDKHAAKLAERIGLIADAMIAERKKRGIGTKGGAP